jgi:hypothetical protein
MLASAGVAKAQERDTADERARHRIGVGIESLHLANRDEGGSPLVYTGAGWPFRFIYRYDGDIHRHWMAITYIKTGINAPDLTSSITRDSITEGTQLTSHTIDYSWRALQYGYSHYLTSVLDNRARIYLGGIWDNLLFFRYYNYGYKNAGEGDPSLLSWDGLFTIDASGTIDYLIDEDQSVHLTLHTPLVAYVVRPRYVIQDEELVKISLDNFSKVNTGRGKFVTVGDIIKVGGRIAYLHSITSLLDLQVIYNFLYYRYYYPQPTTTATNALGITMMFKF